MDLTRNFMPMESASRFLNRTPIFKTMRPGSAVDPMFFPELYHPGNLPVEVTQERMERMAKYTERASREQDLFLEGEK